MPLTEQDVEGRPSYLDTLERQAREAAARVAAQPVAEPVVDPNQAKLSAHSDALAKRAEMRRTLGRDPGPQPGELSDAEMYDLMEAADAEMRDYFTDGRAVAWENPENDVVR